MLGAVDEVEVDQTAEEIGLGYSGAAAGTDPLFVPLPLVQAWARGRKTVGNLRWKDGSRRVVQALGKANSVGLEHVE